MKPSQQEHLRFWQTLAGDIKTGIPLVESLEHVKAELAGTELEGVTEKLIRDIREGSSLSEAMAPHESTFTRCVCALVRAGEAGGVLDVIARRIAEGLRAGNLGPAARGSEGEPQRYWRTFGTLLSSGVPILETFDLIGEVVSGAQFREATHAIRKAILNGSDMSAPMREHPDVFPEEISRAVEAGERKGDLDEVAFRIADALEKNDLSSLVSGVSRPAEQGEAAAGPVVEYVNQLFVDAVKSRASDIHIDPTEDGRGRVRLRIDGVLQDIEPPPKEIFSKLVNRIKLMGNLDLAEHHLPQDARIGLTIEGKPYDLRVSVVPTVFGERVVLRILRPDAAMLDLEKIGLLDEDLAKVRRLCRLPSGVIICSGPTGSGKTTLMYSMLKEVDREKLCVVTVEDPVEYRLDVAGQIQIDPRRGLTYARVLRHVLRQDPDVIMVGEILDLEILEAVMQCALTGHLAISTLHVDTSAGAIRRLLDVGLLAYRLNSALAAVIAQRLVRVLCNECKQPSKPDKLSLPAEAVEFISKRKGAEFFEPKGCGQCGGAGYRGRTAIHEILVMDDRIRRLVAEGADVAALRAAAVQGGMTPLLIDGLEKAARGITSVAEVIRVVPFGTNV